MYNQGRVAFTGTVESAPRMFPAWDLYVSPSRKEGLPLSLLEAMACSLAVVATDVSGHREVVVHGVTGLLARPDDSIDLAGKMSTVLSDPERRRRMGQVGRARILEAFSIGPMVRAVEEIYRKAIRP